MTRRALAVLAVLALPCWGATAAAQPRRFAPPPPVARPQRLPPPPRIPPPRPAPRHRPAPHARAHTADSTTSLKSRLAIAVATRLLSTGRAADRQRALARLGSDGSPQALDLLLKTLEPGGAAHSARDRLLAVRALAPHVATAEVAQGMVRLMTGVGATSRNGNDPLEDLVRRSAALALAASGDRTALEVLGKAIRQQGPVAEAAAEAIAAHPPRDISPLLHARGVPTLTLARLLGRLGDQRAFEALREMVRRSSPEVRAEAAVALTRLGDLETVPLARHWLATEHAPALKLAAARILALVRAPGSAAAIADLLADDATAQQALALAALAPDPGLVPVLDKRLEKAPPESVPLLLGAIGRAGGDAAARVLARELGHADRAPLAAYALALCPGDAASAALARALDAPATRRLAARAGVVRRVGLGETPGGLSGALDVLLASRDAADRAAGAWGQATLDEARATALLASRDPAIVRAAARALAGKPGAANAARRFLVERDPRTRAALAVALSTRQGANAIPTRMLLDLLDMGGIPLPPVAYALAIRDDDAERPRIEALLESGDPEVRAATALGLAWSARPDATGLLERAYRFEADARVRRATLTALGHRGAGRRTLELAARLDGDAEAREVAHRALHDVVLVEVPPGHGTLWIAVSRAAGSAADAAAGRPALVVPAAGPPLPVVTDPDGLLVVAGLPAGPVEARLAADAGSDNARPGKP